MADDALVLDGKSLTLSHLEKAASRVLPVVGSEEALAKVAEAWDVGLEYVRDNKDAYGLTTMFGHDKDKRISAEEMKVFNRIVLIQHATRLGGTTPLLDDSTRRLAWIILCNGFLNGATTVRPELVKLLLNKVSLNEVPSGEDGGSMGAADLIPLAQMATGLLREPGFELQPGESLALMSSNAVSMAKVIEELPQVRRLLNLQKLAIAMELEGFQASPSAVSPESVFLEDPSSFKRKVAIEIFNLVGESLKIKNKGQPFLSLRDAPELIASAEEALKNCEEALEAAINSHQGNPIVHVPTRTILSCTNYNSARVSAAVDGLRRALAAMLTINDTRTQKLYSRRFTGLNSGLTSDQEPLSGVYTRNIPYWHGSLIRNALICTNATATLNRADISEGVEDYSDPLPENAVLLSRAVSFALKAVAVELLLAVCLLKRKEETFHLSDKARDLRAEPRDYTPKAFSLIPYRHSRIDIPLIIVFVQKGDLQPGDLTKNVRTVTDALYPLTPMVAPEDALYTMEPVMHVVQTFFLH